MSEAKVLLKDASGPQMRKFASAVLGMEFPRTEANESVRAKIASAWNKDEIDVIEDAAPMEGTVAPVTILAKKNSKVKIRISRTEGAGGKDPVPAGVNGKIMLIPRGLDVEIPKSYFEVLTHAIIHVFEPLEDGKGIDPIPREVPAYPFQRLA